MKYVILIFQRTVFILFILFALAGSNRPVSNPGFTYKVYGNIASYFENKNDLLSFFEFKKGEVVAEVGAGNAKNIGGISILTDSLTLYAQDIDTTVLNQKNLNKAIKKAEQFKKPITNTYYIQIGTEKTTLLPDNSFDKILLIATFHEFFYMDDMVTDIYKKLKPGGKLYILESECLNKEHKNYTVDETIAILKKNHFRLIKKDGKNLNGATGLYRAVFAKEIP